MGDAVKRRGLGFAACALASSFWGTGFFFGKIALREMNSGAMVLYRFVFAALVLVPLLFTHRAKFSRREWGVLLVASSAGGAAAVFAAVLWPFADDGEPCEPDGGDDAGDPGAGCGGVYARADGQGGVDGAGCSTVGAVHDCAGAWAGARRR